MTAKQGRSEPVNTTESAEDAARRFAAECEQLRRENAALTRQVDALRSELDSRGPSTAAVGRRAPGPPSFALSEGERADLEARGVATSPWTGEQLLADEHGITPATDEARAAQDRARAARDAADAGT